MLVATAAILVACVVGEESSSRAVQIVCAFVGTASATVLTGLILCD
jgi:hypothetical protein